jgi:photosystem II stability/assembly factor-like uncharacterized protein
MKIRRFLLPALAALSLAAQPRGERNADDPLSAATFAPFRLRNLGPAFTSGRITSLAVHPELASHYYAGAASGGVWKTVNNGITWTPVFDREGSYSIGVVALDPRNPAVVWVGTGENNNQRSVSYGDGIYKSEDGGKTWRNMGLKKSEHIARILFDTRNPDVMYVAAPGPLWAPGGDRGLFKSTDGGKTWTNILKGGDYTGVADVVMDPRNPDVLIAATHQRERKYYTLIHGGPESALHRSTDGGKSWTRLTQGIPPGELGRIGLAWSTKDPDIVYAQIEANEGRGGIFRSTDRGVTWERRNPFDSQGQYYAHVVADPHNANRIYVMNVNIQVSDDGGRTLAPLPSRNRHVDNHVLWVDPRNPDHYLNGNDGGLYETFDRGENWEFKANLPVTQFYDVGVDESGPFYHVYGGTQDNFSFGCPAKTRNQHGITNLDCFVTHGGDGFHTRVDPRDPNTVYATMQNGGLVRFDRRTGERVGIQPKEGKGEPPLRWNWDSPLLISPHANTRLYFGANKLFRSDDRGDSWRAISPDLTRQLDRNKLPVMGKIWGVDAVQKHVSTAFYGNLSAIAESPKKEGLIYAGTDDGLIQVTEDGGKTWRKVEKPAGAPENAYVARIVASQHDANTVYAAFENHQNGDFKPYIVRSADAGRTWTSISGNLPENGAVYALAEDHVNPKLLFAGTEFALYFTVDGGDKWIRLSGGMPTINVRDLAIQRRENDLVAGTFGRGFFILDDYSPLRSVSAEVLQQEFTLFPVKNALSYLAAQPLGGRGKGFQGESLFTAPNPPFGAVFTYYLKNGLETRRQARQRREREIARRNEAAPYPTPEELRAEAEEEAPALVVTIADAAGKVVRRFDAPAGRGFHRVAWDLRGPAAAGGRPRRGGDEDDEFFGPPSGPLVAPGTYKVSFAKRVDGIITPLPGEQRFEVIAEGPASREERLSLVSFQEKYAGLQKAMTAATEAANDARNRLDAMKRALEAAPALPLKVREEIRQAERRLADITRALQGDRALRSRNEPAPVSIAERVFGIGGALRATSGRPTRTVEEQYAIASAELAEETAKLKRLVDTEIRAIEKQLDAAGAPPTPGRLLR